MIKCALQYILEIKSNRLKSNRLTESNRLKSNVGFRGEGKTGVPGEKPLMCSYYEAGKET